MIRKIGLLFLILLVNINVNATCSMDEFTVLKEKAKKIEFSYDYRIVKYEEKEDEFVYRALYTLTAYNLDKDLEVKVTTSISDDAKILKYNKNKTSSLSGYNSGKLNITIKGNTKNCDSVFRMQTINLPYYNFLYNDDICREYPLFKYCQNEFLDYDIYEKNFYVEFQAYLDELEKNKEVKEKSFFEKYFVIICILGLILMSLIILIIVRFLIIFIIKRRSL